MDFYVTAILQALGLSGLCLGIFVSMKIFNIPDITTDGSYTLGGTVTALSLSNHNHPLAVLPVVFIAGGLSGAFTGLIHAKLKVNPLLSGILVMTALYSINLNLMGRSNIPLIDSESFYALMPLSEDQNVNTLIMLLLFVAIIFLVLVYLLKTDFGISMRATGNSETMIRALGVNTDSMKITGLAIANAFTASSGFLITQFQGFADINMGIGIVITGLGSVIIAETFINWFRITSIRSSLLLVLAGSIIFQVVLSAALSLGIDASLLKLITALLVLLIVSLPRFTLSRRYD